MGVILSYSQFLGSYKTRGYRIKHLESYKNIFPHISGFRSIFCMTLSNCLLAENVFNIVVNGHTFIWDISAIKLIVEESGGILVDFKGQPINFNLNNPKQAYNVISCHPGLKNEVLKFF